jgi:competence protein ComGF
MRKIRSQVHDFYANDRGSGLMRKPTCHQSRHFTLLEILVAIAVLVVMMGFIFQFINSALKIWSASNSTMSLFDTAQIVFDVLEADVQNALITDEPGREIPVYLKKHGKDLYFGLLSNFSSTQNQENSLEAKVGTYPVLYLHIDDKDLLYRCAIDMSEVEMAEDEKKVPQWFLFGMDTSVADFFRNLIKEDGSPFKDDLDRFFDVIAEGVDKIQIEILPDVSGYSTDVPKVVKVSLTLYDAAAIQQLQSGDADDAVLEQKKIETARRFSKIIFLR